jgi:uncharacterized protein
MEDSPLEHEPPFRWRWSDLLVFGIFFLGAAFSLPVISFVVFRFFHPGLEIKDLSGTQLVLIQTLLDATLVAFICFLAKGLHGRPILQTMRWIRQPRLGGGRMIVAGVLLALTAVIVSSTLLPTPSDTQLEKLLRMTPPIVVFLFGAVVGPLAEEIIFRGFIFTVLEDLLGGKAAVPATAVLFAALHLFQRGGNLGAVAIIFVVGYVFTIVRQRTGSVIPSVIMHIAYNATLFLLPTIFVQKTA